MTEVLIRHGEWIVICDGAKALVLENTGDAKAPNLETREVYAQKAQPTHDYGTDAPGRSMNSNGRARSAVRQTDWHEQAEREFLGDLAKRLDAAVTAGQVKSMIVVAPPRALGMMRAAYTPTLRGAVRAEMDKDYVKLPVNEIEKHLAS